MFELIEIKTEKEKVDYKIPLLIKNKNNGQLYLLINSYNEDNSKKTFRSINMESGILQASIYSSVEEVINKYDGVICKSTLSYEI